MKFTDEELSRVLSAHAGNQLRSEGDHWPETNAFSYWSACVIQAAKCISNPNEAARVNTSLADWFDRWYHIQWTPDEFLRELEKQGVA